MKPNSVQISIELRPNECSPNECSQKVISFLAEYFPTLEVAKVKEKLFFEIEGGQGHVDYNEEQLFIEVFLEEAPAEIDLLEDRLFSLEYVSDVDLQVTKNRVISSSIFKKLRGESGPLIATTLIVSFCSIVYEFLLAQTMSSVLGNTAFRYNLTIGLYAASLGIGALLYKKIIRNMDLREVLVKVEILLSIIGGLAPILALVCDFVFQYLHTKGILSYRSFISETVVSSFTHFLVILIGFISGIELPLLMEIGSKIKKDFSKMVLVTDYGGTLVGAIAFPILLVPFFSLFSIGFIIALLNILAAFLVCIKFRFTKLRNVVVSIGVFYIVLLFFSSSIHEFIVNRFYMMEGF